MDYYKSPSIQIFETSASTAEALVAGPGVATVGFATRGPINELLYFSSYEQFERAMGKPIDEYPLAHLLARRVFATGAGTLYFVRAGYEGDGKPYSAKRASVYVTNPTQDAVFGRYFFKTGYWKADYSEKIDNVEFLVFKKGKENNSLSIKIEFVGGDSGSITSVERHFTIDQVKKFADTGEEYPVIHIDNVISSFNNDSVFPSKAIMKKTITKTDGTVEYGIYIETKNYTDTVSVSIVSEDGVALNDIAWENVGNKEYADHESYEGLVGTPSVGESGNFVFKIEAKNPGSGMNNVQVKKYISKKTFKTDKEVFTIEVKDQSGKTIETFSNLTNENFISRINDSNYGSSYIYLDVLSNQLEDSEPMFKDGTYVLGEGTLLGDGSYEFNKGEYKPEKGKDGVPSFEDEPYNYKEVITDLFVSALGEPALLNMDNVFYSIIATPDSQNSRVQDAAIEVATKRGDAIYLADVPLEYCIDKETVKKAIAWHNGGSSLRGSAIESSYAAVYYGWTMMFNEYSKNNSNIQVPPSVHVAPKMLVNDANEGTFAAPAGVRRGRITAYDYLYSPDMEDREEMMGGDNCINPIVYSNTRGLMIYGQKTADRTGSALNRVNIRRMVNDIKAQLFTSLDVVKFELNNSSTRERARMLASDILLEFRNAGAVETYTVDVSSPGGAERDVLNVYISLVPVGLIERIRIFIDITEGGVIASEG